MRTRSIRFLAPCAFLISCTDTQPAEQGTAIALSTDQRGIPRMLQARGLAPAPAATAMQSARVHVERLAGHWGVAPGMMPVLDEVGEVPVRGGTIARMRQVLDGMPVWGRELRAFVRPGGELATVSGTLVSNATPRAAVRFQKDEASAIASAVERAYGTQAGIVVDEAMAKRVWYPEGNHLVAAWVVDAFTSRTGSTHGDAHRTIIAADSGRILEHRSLVSDATFQYSVFAETNGEKHPFDGPMIDATPHPSGQPDGFFPAYRTGPNLVSVEGLNVPGDPWLADGATETNGNNVDAYVDFNAPNGLSENDFRANVTEPGKFGYVYDLHEEPMSSPEQQKASITSLFYGINWLHDFWYDAGFNEAAGNAQLVNYGRGGVEGDPIKAEAQDNALGGSRNNANMATPADGMSPRMQVFLWTGKEERTLSLPNRSPAVGTASFGPKAFDTSGTLVVGSDATGANPTDGCEAFASNLTGKIVVVDRGTCSFKTKALNIQTAGGTAMILVNNVAGNTPPGMGDDPNVAEITIPSFSVTLAEGTTLKNEIQVGAINATLHRKQSEELDGALDSTLLAHEFGHYLHHRLSLCGNAICGAMSEGWGDFLALMLMARPNDNLDGAFPFSVYTTQSFPGDPAYYGIRRAPYSINKAVNGLMYRHMADGTATPTGNFKASGPNSEVHNAGEVWAAALWEGYVALQKAGTDFIAVRKKMAQYVVAGLMLTPPEASPMEVRDAILAAARAANSQADADLLMEAFARRGFGSCAVAPTLDDFTDLVESTDIAGRGDLESVELVDECDQDGILDTGETAKLKVRIANKGHAALTNVRIEPSADVVGMTILSSSITVPSLAPYATTDLEVDVKLDDATTPIAGTLSLAIVADGACSPRVTIPVAFRVNVDEREEASATETFDTDLSVWDASTAAWTHVRESALDGAWHGDDVSAIADTMLTSPLLTASASTAVTLTFQHSFSFETGTNNVFYDGGVIEYSTDDGATWLDVATLGPIGYGGVLADGGNNPLSTRNAFVGTNPAWPDPDTVTVDFGTTLAGKQFRIRFRIGTDTNAGAPGWTVDDLVFSGLEGTPFPAQEADDGSCAPDGGGDGSGSGDGEIGESSGCCDAGPLRGVNLGLALGVLGLVLRRRRRR